LLLWQLYRALRTRAEDETTVWELPRSRRRLVDLVSQAPLLAKTHTGGAASQAFEAELDQLMQQIAAEQSARSRLVPLLSIAISLLIALLVLGLGVNLLAPASSLSVSSALVLGLALTGAIAGATRLTQAVAGSPVAGDAARAVYQFLKVPDDAAPSEQRVGLATVRDAVVVQDVELDVEGGGPILNGVSLEFRPGEMVALMGTRPVTPLALAELILGIGRPNRGRIVIDGIDLKDVHPRSLSKIALWVGADGPISEGTLLQNIIGEDASTDPREVTTLIDSLGIDNLLARLEDGLQTALSAGDRRLTNEEKYAIGIARAVLHRPPLIVIQEPPPTADELGGDRTIEALRKLCNDSSLVLILPRRLTTLRAADRVVLFNGAKLAGEGKHNGLLQSSDLYRHLNYLLFNPYRSAT
jgi:ATP-binding cassette, subfamily B, bacterial